MQTVGNRNRMAFMSSFACVLSVFWMLPHSGTRAANVVVNGEFAGSLAPWKVEGTGFNTGSSGVLSDSLSFRSALFQSIAVDANSGLVLEFDLLNGLSSSAGGGFVPDSFYATLYLGSQPFGPTISGSVFDTAFALFDMDSTGSFAVAAGGSFGPSPKGSGWSRFTLNRDGSLGFPTGYLTIAFESYNLNGVSSDSVVALDNVSLVPVPEPSAACLLVAASILLIRRTRPSSRHHHLPSF
jgi:hypothetical protein